MRRFLDPLHGSAIPAITRSGIRPPAVAGSWYPDRASLLMAEADRMMRVASSAPRLSRRPIVLIVPHAGWRFSGIAAAAAFRSVRPGDFDRVVLVGPSHYGGFEGFSVPDATAWRTPIGDVPLCTGLLRDLRDGRIVRTVAGVDDHEHCLEIELPFLQMRLDDFEILPILAGSADAGMQKTLASRLAALDDGRTLYVFSSDFTHYGPRYGYTPFGRSTARCRQRIRALDDRALGFFSPPDAVGFRAFLEETSDTICGRIGLGVLLELIPLVAPHAKAVPLATYTSADVPGFASEDSVSYVAMAWVEGGAPAGEPLRAPPEETVAMTGADGTCRIPSGLGPALVGLARASLRTELEESMDLRESLRALPPPPSSDLDGLRGAFVTLLRTDPAEIRTKGELRGCVGQVDPVYPLPQAVIVSAVKAALADTRFPPVTPQELSRIRVEVSVLTPPRPVAAWRDIRLGRDGIVLKKDGYRAVFLPEVPGEWGWNLEQTLSQLARKAGLSTAAWREGATFEVFESQKFAEPRQG